jgi:hypothetical protein
MLRSKHAPAPGIPDVTPRVGAWADAEAHACEAGCRGIHSPE